MPKLHDIPPRALTPEGKPLQRQHIHTKTYSLIRKEGPSKSKNVKPKYVARKKPPGEVPQRTPSKDWAKSVYRVGDGDFTIPYRLGADDHKQFKSFGDRT